MSFFDQKNADAFRELPPVKLSWKADRRIRRLLSDRATELGLRPGFQLIWRRLVAVPMALMLLVVSTLGYAYTSSSVVQGDALFGVKVTLEEWRYPRAGSAEERIAYHLWLSDRRYAEVFEILKRRSLSGNTALKIFPIAHAAGEDSDLDEALRLTLRAAYRNTEAAVEISTEIREVHKAKEVHRRILETVERHSSALKSAEPLLRAVEAKDVFDRGEGFDLKADVEKPKIGSADFHLTPEFAPKRKTLQDIAKMEQERQALLLEKLSLAIRQAEFEKKEVLDALPVIPEQEKLLQPKNVLRATSPDRFEHILLEAGEAHQRARREADSDYQRLFTPLDTAPDVEDAITEVEGKEKVLGTDLPLAPTPSGRSEADKRYESILPHDGLKAGTDELRERELLEQRERPLPNRLLPHEPTKQTLPQKTERRYEPRIPETGEFMRTPADLELEAERKLLEQ